LLKLTSCNRVSNPLNAPTSVVAFIKIAISINGLDSKKRVTNASVQFLRRLANRTGIFINTGFPVKGKKASIKISFDTISNLSIVLRLNRNSF